MKQGKYRQLAALVLTLLLAAGAVWAALSAKAEVPDTGNGARMVLQAKNKKKKKKSNTPTPMPAAAVTPAEAETVPEAETGEVTPTPVPDGPIIDPQSIADYIFAHGELPENFLTKREAQNLGWDSRYNYVSDVAPGMSIGGDRFGNYEGALPKVQGRQYYEADCWYTGGKRNAYRVIYSNDGHVWYTEDHYQTFTELFPTVPAMTSAP